MDAIHGPDGPKSSGGNIGESCRKHTRFWNSSVYWCPVSGTRAQSFARGRCHSAMRLVRQTWFVVVLAAMCACTSAPAASPSVPEPAAAPPGAMEQPQPETPPEPQTDCGALNCRLFTTPEDAVAVVLERDPLVVAIGETHAPRDVRGVPSTTSRFTTTLLPLFAHRSSDVVLELWVADGSCGQDEAKVSAEQEPVTEPQRETNQNDFLVLGQRANDLGIRPHVLRPSCEEYQAIASAGDASIDKMLTLIADYTARLLRAILERNARQGRNAMVLAYGGAIHNDLVPREGREAWSFGPTMDKYTHGQYVEVDLITPEFIRPTEVWKALPWYEHFDPDAHPHQATLFEPAPGSYVLVFPRSDPARQPVLNP